MTGDMTIRGVTRRMTIPVTLPRRPTLDGTTPGPAFESTFQIDRTEFGLNGSPNVHGFHVSISKKVQIHIAIATRLDLSQPSRDSRPTPHPPVEMSRSQRRECGGRIVITSQHVVTIAPHEMPRRALKRYARIGVHRAGPPTGRVIRHSIAGLSRV